MSPEDTHQTMKIVVRCYDVDSLAVIPRKRIGRREVLLPYESIIQGYKSRKIAKVIP